MNSISAGWPTSFQFACHVADCRPPGSGGTGGSSKTGGQGGIQKVVKTKSIPNVSDERLLDSRDQLHQKSHTPEGIRAHDAPRRQLIEQGMKAKQITQELIKRGHAKPTCKFCDLNEFPTDPAPRHVPRQKGARHH